jgi:hypothetical protein
MTGGVTIAAETRGANEGERRQSRPGLDVEAHAVTLLDRDHR